MRSSQLPPLASRPGYRTWRGSLGGALLLGSLGWLTPWASAALASGSTCGLAAGPAIASAVGQPAPLGPKARPVGPRPEAPSPALRRLEGWARASAERRARIEPERASRAVSDALHGAPEDEAFGERLDGALLELIGLAEREQSPKGGSPDVADSLEQAWMDGLAARLNGQWGAGTLVLLADRVLLMPGSFSAAQRIGAARLLCVFPRERAVKGLGFLASDSRATAAERLAAIEALVSAPGELALGALLRVAEFGEPKAKAAARQALLRRFAGPGESARRELPPEQALRLAELCLDALVDPDWTVAHLAAELAGYADAERAVPALIEALIVWLARQQEADSSGSTRAGKGIGTGRMVWTIQASLQRLTGRNIAPDPESWRRMMAAVAAGAPLELGTTTGSRAASFFGLELRSSHVAFIVDRSGSMEAAPPGGIAGRTPTDRPDNRLEAAAEELLRALQRAGPSTWFQIALFSDEGILWRQDPTAADDAGRRAARSFLDTQHPGGGTHLSEGVRAWLAARDPKTGRPLADTVVILCDGETVEGVPWARALLKDPALEGIRFHGVQIGGASASAMQFLTDQTGGKLVRL